MALIYRAIWEEDRPRLIDAAAETTVRWLEHKGLLVDELPVAGELTGSWTHPYFGTEAGYRLITSRATSEGVSAYRMSFDEDRVDEGQQWTTTMTVLVEDGAPGTLWVDIERQRQDPFAYVPFRAPQLVMMLIAEGQQPRVGHVHLEPRPVVIPVEGLVGLIRNATRRLPVAVFSHDRFGGAEATLARSQATYERLAGVAQVFVLPEGDVERFSELIGEELAVWGGGARLYLPNTGPSGLRPDRHRYVPGLRAARYASAAADVFVAQLEATVPATPAPLHMPGFVAPFCRAALAAIRKRC